MRMSDKQHHRSERESGRATKEKNQSIGAKQPATKNQSEGKHQLTGMHQPAISRVKILTIYLNERKQGYCDSCMKEVRPEKLIRNMSRNNQADGEILEVISYICKACNQ